MKMLNYSESLAPFDYYAPSIDIKHLKSSFCNVCGIIFPNKTQMLQHRRVLHPRAKPQLEFADCLPQFLK